MAFEYAQIFRQNFDVYLFLGSILIKIPLLSGRKMALGTTSISSLGRIAVSWKFRMTDERTIFSVSIAN